MRKWISLLVVGAMLTAGCTPFIGERTGFADEERDNYAHSRSERYMMAVLWQQRAGEAIALQYQAYNLAKSELADVTKGKTKQQNSKYAIILDIDETILDNSPLSAQAILDNTEYPNGWSHWVQEARAKMIAGSKDFLIYANRLGVQIFYITNRDENQRADTITNLKKHGLPQVNKQHLILKDTISNKEARRQMVASKYHVIMLVGDNLNDFSDDFYNKSVNDREQAVHHHKKLFGTKYIILPNPMYGDWEDALYHYKEDISDQQKANLRRSWLVPMR